MIKLENELQLFVPSYDNGGQKVDVTMYEKTLCAMVGGATTYKANGKWLDDSKLYNDDMNVITANGFNVDLDSLTANEVECISDLMKIMQKIEPIKNFNK